MEQLMREFCNWLEQRYGVKVPKVRLWDTPLPLYPGQRREVGKMLAGKLTETPEIWVWEGFDYEDLLTLAHEFHHYLRKLQGFRDPNLNEPQNPKLELLMDIRAWLDLYAFRME